MTKNDWKPNPLDVASTRSFAGFCSNTQFLRVNSASNYSRPSHPRHPVSPSPSFATYPCVR